VVFLGLSTTGSGLPVVMEDTDAPSDTLATAEAGSLLKEGKYSPIYLTDIQ